MQRRWSALIRAAVALNTSARTTAGPRPLSEETEERLSSDAKA